MHEPRQVFDAYPASQRSPGTPPRFCPACGTAWADDSRCRACGHRVFANPAPAVSVLVADGTRVLLGRRRAGSFAQGAWCLPCGYIDYGEDFLTAGRREVREETGIGVEITGILSVVSNFHRPDLHSLVVVLLARSHDHLASPQPGDDADAAAWFDSAAPLPPLAFEADAHIIERYFGTRITGAPIDPRHAGPSHTFR